MLNTAMNPQLTILYVAERTGGRAEATDALRKAGLNVREASTGSEALASVAGKPDLILLGVNLPDLSGFEVCRRLKGDPALAPIPVLLMSATFTEAAHRLEALAAGADDYVLESWEPAELLDHIRALLSVQRSEDSSELSPENPSF